MREPITLNYIKERLTVNIAIASKRISKDCWSLIPHSCEFDTHKAKYARAFPDGVIRFNPAFIGTKAFNKLEAVIRHELAHCIVGLEQNHNKHFRRINDFLMDGLEVPEEEILEVINKTGFKWRLIYYTKVQIFAGLGSFKRTKKYTQYDPESGRYMTINGEKVLNCKYVKFEDPLPDGAKLL